MIKIFFITFFIAELIIAAAIILKLRQFDKQVLDLEKSISEKNEKLKDHLASVKNGIKRFNEGLNSLRTLIVQKQRGYAVQVLKNFLFFVGFCLLKGKYKKTLIAYQIVMDIYDGIQESL